MPETNACLDAMNLPILKAKTIVWIYYTINCGNEQKMCKNNVDEGVQKDMCKCIIVLKYIAQIAVSIYDIGDKNKM
mgnify:CR=1 FL=1